jgi:hypothetical protein
MAGGYSIFDIQNEKHAKAIRLKGEGFKPGEWKNKIIRGILQIALLADRVCKEEYLNLKEVSQRNS